MAACSLSALPAGAAMIHIQTQPNVDTALNGVSDIAVSTDGKFVYAAAYQSNAVGIFQRDLATGMLAYSGKVIGVSAAFSVDVSPDNKNVYVASPTGSTVIALMRNLTTGALTSIGATGNAGGTAGFVSVNVSADSKNVYGVGGQPSGLVVFDRNTTTGAITVAADYKDNVDGHELGQIFSPTTSPIKNIVSSPNGQFVYVTSTADSAVTLFSRNAVTGALSQLVVYKDGVGGVDGLQAASSAKISPDGKHLYVSGQAENSVAIFSVNSVTGELTYLEKITNGVAGISDMQGVRSLAISPDGRYVYASAITSDSVTVFTRNSTTGLLTFDSKAINNGGGVTGLNGPSGMASDPSGRHLYVAGQDAQSIVVFALPTPSVQLSVTTGTAAFNGAATILDPQLRVIDADSPNLTSATVSIGTGFVSTDLLSAQSAAGINVSYNAGTGVLSLTGTASLANYQAVLRTLSFRSGVDPSVAPGGYSTRNININVSDGANTSALSSIVITVGPAGGGVPGPTGTVSIPTLSEWGLILMSSIFGLLGIALVRGRRQSNIR
jgi:6-phosphogluconolactonase (cycloisomerase 2 family)